MVLRRAIAKIFFDSVKSFPSKHALLANGTQVRTSLNFKYVLVIVLLSFGFKQELKAQLFELDTVSQYDFVRYDLNRLSVKDSTTLGAFFEKLYHFETSDSGKVRILHIGDSHIQAGYFTGKVRECLHKGLGCGTRERGFIFPFGLAHTNGPINYGAKYTGDWKGFKSSSNIAHSDWGVAGISASTKDECTTLKIYTNNHTFDSYSFNRIRLYYRDDSSKFSIDMTAHGSDSITCVTDSFACYKEYSIEGTADTLYFTFQKDSLETDAAFLIQGIELLNDNPGITYSEVGVNGAKVKSFLKCGDFTSQFATLNPDLVVLSLGINDAYNLNYTDSVFYQYYDSLIQIIKFTLPGVDIILTTPGDGKRHRKTVLIENLSIRNSILKLAKENNCAVWDFFNVMGGLGSINKWHKNKLTAADFLHLNEKGYHLQGELFYTAIHNSYNSYTQNRRIIPLIINEGVDYEELLVSIFFYNPNEPLFFSHYLFWLFFTVFFMFYALVYKNLKIRSVYLFLFSLFFYYKAGGLYFGLLILSTVVDYLIGNKIFKATKYSHRKYWLATSVIANLSLLFFFKYSGFITDSINYLTGLEVKPYNVFSAFGNLFSGGSFDVDAIILPVGISFYTFQTISYSVDIYRKKIDPVKSIVDFGFYVSFFPQLVAGPIVRANEFIPQIYKKYQLTKDAISRASFLILGGLFKKMVISDYISTNFVDRVFETPLKYSGFENLMGAYGYTIQIYCDFSAYSDIAIGLALLMGFTLPQNFNRPYLSSNITDFWRRWHISLSRWLKDYLYIPLGGNRKGKVRTYVNLFITMLLGGLWHGAALKFIIWGGLHGSALAIHKGFRTFIPLKSEKGTRLSRFLGWFITFHFVVFCWVFFRAPTNTAIFDFFSQLFFNFDLVHFIDYIINPSYITIFTVVLFAYISHLIPDSVEMRVKSVLGNKWWPVLSFISVFTIILIYQFKSSEIQPFIYFQF